MSPFAHRVAVAIAAALLPGCAAEVNSAGRQMTYAGQLEAGYPVQSMLEQRFTTVVRQQYDFSCGSAALATLLRYHYNEPVDEKIAFAGMWRDGDKDAIRKLGFSLLDMKRFLASAHLSADGYKVGLDQIARAQTPGIALIDVFGYKHFVVVKGLEGASILLGDPAVGLRRMSAREFVHHWNGVLFVINGRDALAHASFNRPAELALSPSGRTTLSMEPISQAALALTRPGPDAI